MKHTKEFEFGIGEVVQIRAIERPGIVTGFMVEVSGSRVRVEFWNDGERKDAWVFASELARTDGTKEL